MRDRKIFRFREYRDMEITDEDVRAWLADEIKAAGRGSSARLADHLRISPTAVSRASKLDTREPRQLSAIELLNAMAFFKSGQALLERVAPFNQSRSIPLLSKVSAGGLLSAGDLSMPYDTDQVLEVAGINRPHVFALEVDGDSMDRLSPPGSVIIVDMADRVLVEGRPFVFSLRGEATYKLWYDNPPRLEPSSTNPANKIIFTKEDQDYAVIGRVIRTILDL